METFPLAVSTNRSLPLADDSRWVEMEVLQSFHNIFFNVSYEENFTAKLHTLEYSTLLEEFKMTLHTYRQLRTLVLISLYVPVFLCAFFGNIIVLMVVLPNRHMRSVTNCFIVNLAVADILVTVVCVPVSIGKRVYKLWIYGQFMCKLSGYMQGVSVASSVFTIMVLSVDRYLAIRHPMRFRAFSNGRHTLRTIIVIWLLSFGVMVPLLLVYQLHKVDLIPREPFVFCNEVWENPRNRHIYDATLFVLLFIIPGLFVFASYSRIGVKLWTESRALYQEDTKIGREQADKIMTGRRKVARMLLILAIVFAVCWLPCHILHLYLDFVPGSKIGLDMLPFTIWLGHANSAFNPIIYCFMNRCFRRCTGRLLRCGRRRSYIKPPTSPVSKVRRVQAAASYSRFNGTQRTSVPSRHQLHSSSRRSTTSSVRFSRSTNTSFRSSQSRRNSLDRNVLSDPDMEVPRGSTPERNPCNSSANSAGNKREIFNCTLSIPSTINEETSRSSFSHTGILDRFMFKAVLEVSEKNINAACNNDPTPSVNDPISVLLMASSDTRDINEDNTTTQNTTQCHGKISSPPGPTSCRVEPEGRTDVCGEHLTIECHADAEIPCIVSDDTMAHSEGELLSSDDCDCDECDNLLLEGGFAGLEGDYNDTELGKEPDTYEPQIPFKDSILCTHCD